MTALKKYLRLEATAQWKESTKSNQREVLVSLGKSSLIIYDYNDSPLSHWSLPSLKLISRKNDVCTFSTTTEGYETLVISDKEMNDALLRFIKSSEPKRKKNKFVKLIVFFALFSMCIWTLSFIPKKLNTLVTSIISSNHEVQLFEPYYNEHIRKFGPICNSPKSSEALQYIMKQISPEEDIVTVQILRKQKNNMLHLPAAKILISNQFIQSIADPNELVSILKTQITREKNKEPLKILIQQQSFQNLLKFLLGTSSNIVLKSIEVFKVPTVNIEHSTNIKLDDFSWVALQNTCIN